MLLLDLISLRTTILPPDAPLTVTSYDAHGK